MLTRALQFCIFELLNINSVAAVKMNTVCILGHTKYEKDKLIDSFILYRIFINVFCLGEIASYSRLKH